MSRRVVTGLILLALALSVILYAPLPLLLFIGGILLAWMAYEWRYLLDPTISKKRQLSYALLTLATTFLLYQRVLITPCIMLAWALVLPLGLLDILRAPKAPLGRSLLPWGYWMGWILFPALFFSARYWILVDPHWGRFYLLGIMALIWGSDTGAYFVGKRWGRRQLAPQISPGKTWEGVGGAYLLPVLALLGGYLARLPFHFLSFMALSMLLLIPVGILGDLFESCYKRSAGLKDSGRLLPGHGGILDRVDALFFTLPLSVALASYLNPLGA